MNYIMTFSLDLDTEKISAKWREQELNRTVAPLLFLERESEQVSIEWRNNGMIYVTTCFLELDTGTQPLQRNEAYLCKYSPNAIRKKRIILKGNPTVRDHFFATLFLLVFP